MSKRHQESNNAVARVAGVLPIAVLGVMLVNAFSSRLNDSLVELSLPPGILEAVQSSEIKLAGMTIPADLVPTTKTALTESIGEAFVFGFRTVMLICLGLSVDSGQVVRFEDSHQANVMRSQTDHSANAT